MLLISPLLSPSSPSQGHVHKILAPWLAEYVDLREAVGKCHHSVKVGALWRFGVGVGGPLQQLWLGHQQM
jgi:hypothetical protein